MSVNFNDLVKGFKEVGVCEGDILLVHSSYKSFGGVDEGPENIIKALQKIITKTGTLIVPTFNYDFCDGVLFDVLKTPSKMGIISEIVRKNYESKRRRQNNRQYDSDKENAGLKLQPASLGMHNRQKIT